MSSIFPPEFLYIKSNSFSLLRSSKFKMGSWCFSFIRKIYLKSYRYNMHLCPKSLLIEVGAQTNTLQEAVNAMDPLAQVLDKVLSGK